MKTKLLCLVVVALALSTMAAHAQQRAFITTWQTEGANEQITIPLNPEFAYNFQYIWKDSGGGVVENGTHTSKEAFSSTKLTTSGIYTLEITGDFPHLFFGYPVGKLIEVNQWGDIAWGSMKESFSGWGGTGFIATDVPDLSQVTDMGDMFLNADSFNGDLSDWDVSNVENMLRMFLGAAAFDGDLGTWEVDNVTNMAAMFNGAVSFEGERLSSWNTGKVTNMSSMFDAAESFNGNLGEWDVSNVRNMAGMFQFARSFNGDLSEWDVSKVTNMTSMFDESGLSAGNYDRILIGWAAQQVQDNVPLGAKGINFCNGDIARGILERDHFWGIFDAGRACSELKFITLWETKKDGERIEFGTNTNLDYNYEFTWKDSKGNKVLGGFGRRVESSSPVRVEMGEAGKYTLEITGTFPHFTGYDKEKLLDVKQWGGIVWLRMNGSFAGWPGKKFTAKDVPDLSRLTNMNNMFNGAGSFNGDLSTWDVSNVENMAGMFEDAQSFNGDLSSWNVENVENMASMFEDAEKFQGGNLSGWNTGKVKDMQFMFFNAAAFDGDLSTWDVSNVENMASMFSGAKEFKGGNLSGWNTGKVKDMSSMFFDAAAFDGNLSGWKVENVENMASMFSRAEKFKGGNLSGWNTGKVKDMSSMFFKAAAFNGNVNGWNVENVENMASMFEDAEKFQGGDLSGWNTGKVSDMARMFWGEATAFNGNVSTWDVSKVTAMNEMFRGAAAFNGDLSKWDVSNVTTMRGMFFRAGSFKGGNLSGWKVGNVTNMSFMFNGAGSFNGDISAWNTIKVTNMARMFQDAGSFNRDLSAWDVSQVTNMRRMFFGARSFEGGDLSKWQVGKVTNMASMFEGADSFNGDISDWDVSQVTNMHQMFFGAGSFEGENLAWDVSSVADTGMVSMFRDARSFTGDLSGWNTGKLTDMSFMFFGAHSFEGGDLRTWDVSKVTNMYSMFRDARSFTGDVSSWDVSSVTDTGMVNMFRDAKEFNGDLGKWKVGEEVRRMDGMFYGASSFEGTGLRKWNVIRVRNMAEMFRDAASFDVDLGDWKINNVKNMTDMFTGSGLSWQNYDRILSRWGADTRKEERKGQVTLGAGGVNFCESDVFRNKLKNESKWKITDAGRLCPDHFITTWQTTDQGESISFSLPEGLTYNFRYVWRDSTDKRVASGTFPPGSLRFIKTTMRGPGTYTLEIIGGRAFFNSTIKGSFPHFISNSIGKLRDVKQWGNIQWRSMNGSFRDFTGESFTAPDVPDLSRVEDMKDMFRRAGSFNGDLSKWDVSNVTTMARMFQGAGSFNGDLGTWDVSNVDTMQAMFRGAGSFNGDLSGWDVSNVEDMRTMFMNADAFKGEGISGWNTANVTDMSSMFNGAGSFNGDLSGWDVSKVETMSGMFLDARSYNRDLSGLKVGNVERMVKMFDGSGLSQSNYDRTLIGWAAQKELQKNVELGADGIHFCNGADAHEILEDENIHNWTIIDEGKQCPDDATDIITFTLDEEAGPPVINDAAHTVDFKVGPDTDLTALAPALTLPPGATSFPASGQVVDFTRPVLYTVTASNGTTIQLWTVTASSPGVFTQTLAGNEGWRTLSAPGSGPLFKQLLAGFWTQGFAGASTPNGQPNLYRWDIDAQDWAPFTDLAAESLPAGHGFLFFVYSDDNGPGEPGDAGFPKSLQFDRKEAFNSEETTPVSGLADGAFFFAGNPYWHPIDWEVLTRSGLSGTVYVHGNEGWKSWNGNLGNLNDGEIAAFQGFFVQGFGGNGELTIELEDTVSTTVDLEKAVDVPAKSLKITAEAGELTADAWLSFQQGGEPGWDAYDGLALASLDTTFLRLATILDSGQALAINALPADQGEPLVFPLELSGTVKEEMATLSFEGMEAFEEWEIRVVDTQTGADYLVGASTGWQLQLEMERAKVEGRPGSVMPTPVPVKAKASAARYRLILEPPAVVGAEQGISEVPKHVELQQNYPNPFNPATVISYAVPQAGPVRLEVFDLVGRKVATLLERESQGPGRYEVRFDASALASGVYIYRLQAGSHILIKRMTLIK